MDDDDPACFFNTSTISFFAETGTNYYIMVNGFLGVTGDFTLTVTCGPENDACDNAVSITCGDALEGTTTGSSGDAAGFCGTSVSAPGVCG